MNPAAFGLSSQRRLSSTYTDLLELSFSAAAREDTSRWTRSSRQAARFGLNGNVDSVPSAFSLCGSSLITDQSVAQHHDCS